ncbi:MAG: hypothetical protein KJ592_00035 [Nanoarchaeota archaeon]|nr:hypothetical protein [Nanoarchaeota archaeon]
MIFGLFGHKKIVKELREDVQNSFDHVKKDFNKVGEWIKHLDDKHVSHEGELSNIKSQLLSIKSDLIEIKDFISFFGPQISSGLSKQVPTTNFKQVMPTTVQTAVQTGVQSDILESLTVMERAIVWALLNSELKLSYEDLAMVLGKDKSTIRGQINTIKQKEGNIIMEKRESNGKKRLYIPDEIKSMIMKGVKVKVKRGNV